MTDSITSNQKNEFELLKLEFEKALQQRNLELDLYWKRIWFFGALLIALAAGYFQLIDKHKNYCVLISLIGFLVSLAQSAINRGSKWWQESWDEIVKNREAALGVFVIKGRYRREKILLDACRWDKKENPFTSSRRYSISKLAILILDIICLFWLGLWIKDICFANSTISRSFIYIFQGAILFYVLLFIFFEKTHFGCKSKWFPFKLDGGKVYHTHGKIEVVILDENGDAFEIDEKAVGEIAGAYRRDDTKTLKNFGFYDHSNGEENSDRKKLKLDPKKIEEVRKTKRNQGSKSRYLPHKGIVANTPSANYLR